MKQLLSDLSSPKYKKLSGVISLLSILLAYLILLLKEFFIENNLVEAVIFPHVLRIVLFFPLGFAGLVVMLRGELMQAVVVVVKGFFARGIGLIWWLFSWWLVYQAFISITQIS